MRYSPLYSDRFVKVEDVVGTLKIDSMQINFVSLGPIRISEFDGLRAKVATTIPLRKHKAIWKRISERMMCRMRLTSGCYNWRFTGFVMSLEYNSETKVSTIEFHGNPPLKFS